MKFEVNEKVFAFTMLLYGQQLFLQIFNSEGKHNDSEFSIIQPIILLKIVGMKQHIRQTTQKVGLPTKISYKLL